MRKPDFCFDDLKQDLQEICQNLHRLAMMPGPTRCVSKLTKNFDPRVGKNKEFPLFEEIKEIVDEMNRCDKKEWGVNTELIVFQDYGDIILLSGFKKPPSAREIRDVPFALTSHADEITFIKKKNSAQLIPIFNAQPLIEYGLKHEKLKIFGFRGTGANREFREVGSGKLRMDIRFEKLDKKEKKIANFYLMDVDPENSTSKLQEGDVVIQDYDQTPTGYNLDTIFHIKALDDRVGVLSHLYTMRLLNRYNIKAKAILVGDEEGVDKDVAWARLARPAFRKYCREENLIILCDGFDGKNLHEFGDEKRKGKHLQEALIVPYRSEGKGAGDPGIFSLFRDYIVDIAEEAGFQAVTTTDYVSRSLDPKIMDDYPLICSVDWSNGPVVTPTNDYFNMCHVDESVAIKQILNIIGTTFYGVWFFEKEHKEWFS